MSTPRRAFPLRQGGAFALALLLGTGLAVPQPAAGREPPNLLLLNIDDPPGANAWW